MSLFTVACATLLYFVPHVACLIQVSGSRLEWDQTENLKNWDKQSEQEKDKKPELHDEDQAARDTMLHHWLSFYAIYSILMFTVFQINWLYNLPGFLIFATLFVTWLWYPGIWGGSLLVQIIRSKYFRSIDENFIQKSEFITGFFNKFGINEFGMEYWR